MKVLWFLEVSILLKEKLSFSGCFLKWQGLKRETFLLGQVLGFSGFSIYFCMGKALEIMCVYDMWDLAVRFYFVDRVHGLVDWMRAVSMVYGEPVLWTRGC